MNCLDENAISALFEKRLPTAEIDAIDLHVAGCSACRSLLADHAAAFARTGSSSRGEKMAPEADPAKASFLRAFVAGTGPLRRVGTVIREKWTIDCLLGSGGMGDVYAATHRNGRRGALKLLRPELSIEPDVVERFFREGLVANKIGHPGAVTILDEDRTEEGTPFLVMELLSGETLAAMRNTRGRLEPREVLDLADRILDVLAAAHEKHIVHRDLKPENLFLTKAGELKVLDFGIARLVDVEGLAGTDPGVSMGTPAYMPPEQARGESQRADGRADIWSLGACMFNLLTGDPVHRATTPNMALLAAMTKPAPELASRRADVPPNVAAIVDRALAFEPAARFQSARAMQRAIRDALATAPVARPRRRSRARLVGLGVLALTLGGAAFALRHRAPAAASAPATTSAPPTVIADLPPERAAEPPPAPSRVLTPAVSSVRPTPPRAAPRGKATAVELSPKPAPTPLPEATPPADEYLDQRH